MKTQTWIWKAICMPRRAGAILGILPGFTLTLPKSVKMLEGDFTTDTAAFNALLKAGVKRSRILKPELYDGGSGSTFDTL